METATHRALKILAVHRLFQDGCAAAAAEVRCPIARFRVDAAGYLDPLSPRPSTAGVQGTPSNEHVQDACASPCISRDRVARTVIVECKASRADFLTDARDADRLFKERSRLDSVRKAMEDRFVKVVEPHLRLEGSSLFEELDDWNFAESRLPSYRKLLDDFKLVEERLYGQSKFWTISHYRLADFLYLAAPAGLIRPHELPVGWGLLELDARNPAAMCVAVPAAPRKGNPRHRSRMLRNIAAAASRRLLSRALLADDLDIARQ